MADLGVFAAGREPGGWGESSPCYDASSTPRPV